MKLQLNDQGLIPAIVQDEQSGDVLMFAWMSPESLHRTVETGDATFYSRSRQELWRKGDTSGNVIKVKQVQVDCDQDVLLVKGKPSGPVCHTGKRTCFFDDLDAKGLEFARPEPNVVDELFQVIEGRKTNAPEGSYVGQLLAQGVDRIGKKVIEEAGESVIAAKNGVREEVVHEVADLWFHSLILLSKAGLKPEDIWQELKSRRK